MEMKTLSRIYNILITLCGIKFATRPFATSVNNSRCHKMGQNQETSTEQRGHDTRMVRLAKIAKNGRPNVPQRRALSEWPPKDWSES